MNYKRRSDLKRAMVLLEQASSIVTMALDNENECLNNMPENLQYSDRYVEMELAVEKLEEVVECIDNAIEGIEAAMET